MEMPLCARVYCVDGPCGRVTHCVVDLSTRRVTYLVVTTNDSSIVERLVPIGMVKETGHDSIQLCCSNQDVSSMAPFAEIEWRCHGASDCVALFDPCLIHKIVMRPFFDPIKHQRLPSGQLAIHRRTRVEAAGGRVGRVDSLHIHPADHRITQVILTTRRLWAKTTVRLAFSQIERIGKEMISPNQAEPTPAICDVSVAGSSVI